MNTVCSVYITYCILSMTARHKDMQLTFHSHNVYIQVSDFKTCFLALQDLTNCNWNNILHSPPSLKHQSKLLKLFLEKYTITMCQCCTFPQFGNEMNRNTTMKCKLEKTTDIHHLLGHLKYTVADMQQDHKTI